MTYIIQYLPKVLKLSTFFIVLITVCCILPATHLAAEEDDVFTDIILINGQAELADFNKDGVVLMRHVAVPDYFTSGRSHKRSLRNSLNKLKVYGAVEVVPEPIFYHNPVECRQSMVVLKNEVVQDEQSWNLTASYEGDIASIEDKAQTSHIMIMVGLKHRHSGLSSSIKLEVNDPMFFESSKQRFDLIGRYEWVSEEQLLI